MIEAPIRRTGSAMWPYHPDLLESPVPRYTSYPTAAEFGPMPAARYAQALEGAQGDVSLYVHIPFCEQICFYCACNTGKAGKRQRLDAYLEALEDEIERVSDMLPVDAKVRRVAFGGGSPNALEPGQFLRLVDRLVSKFAIERTVFSIELDPRTFSPEWAEAIGSVGIERASLGVQTFASRCQAAIGRVQSGALIERTVDLLRRHGVSSLNFDLMYGLPGQSHDDLRDSLTRSVALGPDRIALFGYAHVPHLVPRQRVIDASALPGQAERFGMAWLGHEMLIGQGYDAIGFDHFAKPGDPVAEACAKDALRRNFQGFTDDPAGIVIGFGGSAVSSFPDLLAQNEKNSGRYRMLVGQGRLATMTGVVRSVEDQIRGRMIEDLLCRGATDIGPIADDMLSDALVPFLDRGLVALDDDLLTVVPDGLPYARTVCALLDGHRPQSARRFSSAV